MKNNKGFTLVEVIVVSVLVAVLSTVATLSYNGYIQTSRQKRVNALAFVAAASANSYYRKTSEKPEVSDLKLSMVDDSKYAITIQELATGTVTVEDLINSNVEDGVASYKE
jgi:prepilin-type N-terminal cleavage/methylation domain-containing protein